MTKVCENLKKNNQPKDTVLFNQWTENVEANSSEIDLVHFQTQKSDNTNQNNAAE